MRQGTGSCSKTNPSSPTRLFSPTANCLSPTVSSSKRLKRRAKLISPPSLQQPPQHCPSILTPLSTFPRHDKYGYFHPLTSAWLKGRNAITTVAETTTLLCADAKDPSNHPTMPEALSTQADCPEEIPGQGIPDDRHRSSRSPGRHYYCPTSHSSSCSQSPYWSTKTPPF